MNVTALSLNIIRSPKGLFILSNRLAAATAGFSLPRPPTAILLFLCLSSMTYYQSGPEINTIHPTNCGHNLTVESNSVYSICNFKRVEFSSPGDGVLIAQAVPCLFFPLCDVCLPTDHIHCSLFSFHQRREFVPMSSAMCRVICGRMQESETARPGHFLYHIRLGTEDQEHRLHVSLYLDKKSCCFLKLLLCCGFENISDVEPRSLWRTKGNTY